MELSTDNKKSKNWLPKGNILIKKLPKVGEQYETRVHRLRESGETEVHVGIHRNTHIMLAENIPPAARVELTVSHRERTKTIDKFFCEFLVTKVVQPGPYATFGGDKEKMSTRWCPHAASNECSGCQFPAITYQRQLVEKMGWLYRHFPCATSSAGNQGKKVKGAQDLTTLGKLGVDIGLHNNKIWNKQLLGSGNGLQKIRPAIHGHREFQYWTDWKQSQGYGKGPPGFKSDIETTPESCNRLPKRLFRALREASETFQHKFAPRIIGVAGKRKDGNFEVIMDMHGGSKNWFIDSIDLEIFVERNPFVHCITQHRGKLVIHGSEKKRTVTQHIKLKFLEKLLREGKVKNVMDVLSQEELEERRRNDPWQQLLIEDKEREEEKRQIEQEKEEIRVEQEKAQKILDGNLKQDGVEVHKVELKMPGGSGHNSDPFDIFSDINTQYPLNDFKSTKQQMTSEVQFQNSESSQYDNINLNQNLSNIHLQQQKQTATFASAAADTVTLPTQQSHDSNEIQNKSDSSKTTVTNTTQKVTVQQQNKISSRAYSTSSYTEVTPANATLQHESDSDSETVNQSQQGESTRIESDNQALKNNASQQESDSQSDSQQHQESDHDDDSKPAFHSGKTKTSQSQQQQTTATAQAEAPESPSDYIVEHDLELGLWPVPGRAQLGEINDCLMEKFVVPMVQRVLERDNKEVLANEKAIRDATVKAGLNSQSATNIPQPRKPRRRVTIWELGGSWPLAHLMHKTFQRMETAKEICIVSLQHPDDVALRKGTLGKAHPWFKRQENLLEGVVQEQKLIATEKAKERAREREKKEEREREKLYEGLKKGNDSISSDESNKTIDSKNDSESQELPVYGPHPRGGPPRSPDNGSKETSIPNKKPTSDNTFIPKSGPKGKNSRHLKESKFTNRGLVFSNTGVDKNKPNSSSLTSHDPFADDPSQQWFPPLTNLIANLKYKSVLERLIILSATQDNFQIDLDKSASDGHTLEETAAWDMTRRITNKKMDHVYASPSDGALMVLEDQELKDGDGGGVEGLEVSEAMKIRLKRAYHSLARRYHPDTAQDDSSSAAKFQAISKAYTDLVKDSPESKKLKKSKEEEEADEHSPSNVFDGISEEELGFNKNNPSPIVFAEDGLETRVPQWLPAPDILVFTLHDCLNGDLRRWIRFNLQIKEFVCILETTIENMKKPVYHFGRLGYILDLIQPFDTHPHNNVIMVLMKFRYIEVKKKDHKEQIHMALIEGRTYGQKGIEEERRKLLDLPTRRITA